MDKSLYFYILILLSVYILLYPKHPMISDEVFYAQQGLMFFQDKDAFEITEWSDGNFRQRNTDIRNYKIGTGLVTGSIMVILGNKARYLIGILSLLVSVLSIAFTLKHMGYSPYWSSLLALSPVNGLLCRTIMSDLPSMALSAIFIYLLIRNKRTMNENLWAAFIVGISFFFRETNILLLGMLSLPFLLGENKYKLLYPIVTLVSGLLFAFITANIFHEPLFSRDLGGLEFSLSNIPENLLIYALGLTVVIPLGSIFIFINKGKYSLLFKAVTITLVMIYLLYEYNGFKASGTKGILLNARFLLPLFPIAIIATAYRIEQWEHYTPRIVKLVAGLSIISFYCMNMIGYVQNENQEKIIRVIQQNNDVIYTSDLESNILKYANYFTGARIQIPFDRKEINNCVSTGETIAVIYSQPIEKLKEWLDSPSQLSIEEKANTIFMDKSSLRLVLIKKQKGKDELY